MCVFTVRHIPKGHCLMAIFIFIFEIYFLFAWQAKWQRKGMMETKIDIPSGGSFSQVAATARVGPGWSLEPGTQFGSPKQVAGNWKHLSPARPAPRCAPAGSWFRHRAARTWTDTPQWDVGTLRGRVYPAGPHTHPDECLLWQFYKASLLLEVG